ncbi:MAG: hypothetical protein IJW24_05115, partial [Clostridia bacterium]|nr:hypothetical protein [Clostridia bacterium]
MKKRLIKFFVLLFIAVPAIVFSGCGVKPHDHQASTTYEHNTTHHWHPCTTDGCKEELERELHSFGQWETINEPSCIAEGSKQRICDCGYVETASIPKTPHTPSNLTVNMTKTDSHHTDICAVCYTHLASVPHTWVNGNVNEGWTETTAPTCLSAGEEQRTCSVCNHTVTKSIPQLNHTVTVGTTVFEFDPDSNSSFSYACSSGCCSAGESISGHILINNETDWNNFATIYNSDSNTFTFPSLKITNDLTFNVNGGDTFVQLGDTVDHTFKGCLNGQDHTISIQGGDKGLFEYLGTQQTKAECNDAYEIKNLTLNINIARTLYQENKIKYNTFGGLATIASGNVTIDNVTITGQIQVNGDTTTSGTNENFAAFIGAVRNTQNKPSLQIADDALHTVTIKNSTNLARVFATNNTLSPGKAAGFVCYVEYNNLVIDNCVNGSSTTDYSTINRYNDASTNKQITIADLAEGEILSTGTCDATAAFLAYPSKTLRVTITNCINHAPVSNIGGRSCIGGIIGNSHNTTELTTILNTHNYGAVLLYDSSSTAKNTYCIGGFVGQLTANLIIDNCSNDANITLFKSETEYSAYIGGFLGYGNNTKTLIIQNSTIGLNTTISAAAPKLCVVGFVGHMVTNQYYVIISGIIAEGINFDLEDSTGTIYFSPIIASYQDNFNGTSYYTYTIVDGCDITVESITSPTNGTL